MFNKRLKFKALVSHRSGAVAALEGQKTSPNTRSDLSVIVGDVEFWCVCPQVSERAGRDRSAERCCQDKAIRDDSEEHAQVFTWQFGSL